eukprot:CAMPEP_0168319484 /NCGR_PEP_ID=MMETSP0213-20121227/1085_1 /TAXON_ID=151035 /ORGANISM="Euplotes harpa, Strain FSP1.4" /LENGTH=182 /DNA_ID=CAMNT_0008320717 /DNA_START=66 /DNA_END=614 /DNA_ORIENTATION=-
MTTMAADTTTTSGTAPASGSGTAPASGSGTAPASGTAAAPAKPAEPGRATPPKPITHTDSEGVLEELQGGNPDVFVITFFADEAKKAPMKAKIDSDVMKDHPWVRTTEVDLKKVKDYYKLFRTLKIEGEPKRGHSDPQVLVMSKGEGFIIRGPTPEDMVSGILKRLEKVEKGTLFSQNGASA